MHTRLWTAALVCSLTAAGCAKHPQRQWQSNTHFLVTDLAPGDGYSQSCATGINSSGHVVGYEATEDGDTRAVMWANGGMEDLGTLGGENSKARAINDADQVAGEAFLSDNGTRHAFLWQSKRMKDLTPSTSISTCAHAIGPDGLVGGQVDVSGPAAGAHAVLYSGTGFKDLCAGCAASSVQGIGPRGEAVGWRISSDNGPRRACLWIGGSTQEIPTQAGDRSWANAINSAGHVVGAWNPQLGDVTDKTGYYRVEPQRAFLWRDGKLQELGSLGGMAAEPNAVNDLDQVVGQADLPGSIFHAFLWDRGRMLDLNDGLPDRSGWILEDATGINRAGQVCGTGTIGGHDRAFLLTPAGK